MTDDPQPLFPTGDPLLDSYTGEWRDVNRACDRFWIKRGYAQYSPKTTRMLQGAALANRERHARARASA
jgi:hypothetical protein